MERVEKSLSGCWQELLLRVCCGMAECGNYRVDLVTW